MVLVTLPTPGPKAKLLLVQVQWQVVADQATSHAMLPPDCRSCGRTRKLKDWQPYRAATLFGEVKRDRLEPGGQAVWRKGRRTRVSATA
jgi:hypothetical protein